MKTVVGIADTIRAKGTTIKGGSVWRDSPQENFEI